MHVILCIYGICIPPRTSIRSPYYTKAFYSSRPGSAWDFTNVRLIFMNDSFIKCVSSILKYWRNVLITEENELINQPHSVVHIGLYCRWPWLYPPWEYSSTTAISAITISFQITHMHHTKIIKSIVIFEKMRKHYKVFSTSQ